MARISTYAIDGTPVSSDKLIGTDTAGTVTKNYPLGDVADWLKSSGATAVLGQNNYLFQIALDPDEGRKIGSFSFENYGGDGTAFEDVTNLKFSASSSAGKYIADYLLSTVDQKIMLSQLDDPNSFGIYVLASLVQSPLEPTFYDATLAVVSSNGVLRGNKSYGLATYSALNEAGGGTWGSITGTITNQTDLVDYIDAEIAAIPTPATPTLQSVTDAGAITTNDITTGSVTSNGNFLITGNDSTVQLRGSSVDFNIQTTAADNVARIATTTGGSARLDLYNHISGFNGALEFRATSWENDALVISGGTPNTTKFLVSRDPNAATLQVTGESYFTGNVGIGTTAPAYSLDIHKSGNAFRVANGGGYAAFTVNPSATVPTSIIGRAKAYSSLVSANNFEILDGLLVQGYKAGGAHNAVRARAISVEYGMDFNSAGSLDYASGVYSRFTTRSAGSGINNAYGFYSTADNPGGTSVTNQYGLYIADTAIATNNYGVYQAGASFKNIFEGNVGIGTTAPNSLLHVARTSNGEVLRLQDTTNANQNYVFETEATGSYYGLNLKNSSTGDTIVNFSANGKLGIKTNNPDKALTINETADNDVQIKIGNHFGIGYSQAGQTRSVIGSIYGNDAAMMSFVLGGYTTASDKMTILGSGNVGIGTTSPTGKLHVVGTTSIIDSTLKLGNRTGSNGTLILQGNNGPNFTIEGVNDTLDFSLVTGNPNGGVIQFSDAIKNVWFANSVGGTFAVRRANSANTDDNFGGIFVESQATTASNGRAIYVSADNNGGIIRSASYGGTGTTGLLQFQVGGNTSLPETKMVMDSSGNFGIGTTAPSSTLHVAGTARIHSAANGAFGTLTLGSINHIVGDVNYINFKNNNNSWMMILNGNVGIGTTAPGYPLHIVASNNSTVLGLDAGSNARFRFAGNSTSGYTSTFNIDDTGLDIGHDSTARSLNLKTGNQDRLTILGSGNVGIGTTAPDEKLRVQGNVKSAGDFIGSAVRLGFAGTANITTYDTNEDLLINPNGSGDILMQTTSGNVGIGTTAPAAKLHVSGELRLNAGQPLMLDTANGIYAVAAQNQFRLYSGGNPAINITTAGRVGIGTTAPTEKLHITGGGAGNIRLDAGGTYYGTNIQAISSAGLKIGNDDFSGYAFFADDSNVGIGTTVPDSKVHISGTAMQQLRMETAGGPSSSGDTSGRIGDMAYDDDFFYIKTANGWGRVQLDFGF